MNGLNAQPISQNPDVRLLGKMLGDVIRAYGGEKLFRQTEYIRSTSVDRFRGIEGADASDRGLGALSLDLFAVFLGGAVVAAVFLPATGEDAGDDFAEPARGRRR